ncbi:MAG: A24 family peptidase [Candidatus Krumholzibacteria bacterium]|nr:A24 family peptidase [Candidatus Krumholzibacteria bacterium]
MNPTPLATWCAVLTLLLVGMAVTTDLMWRRIPNFLTLPALASAVFIRLMFQGWGGLGLAFVGALVAPLLLWAMHGGKGIGMGDLKLAAALGAILGPLLAVVTVLLSAVAGGLLAITWMLRSGGQLHQLLDTLLIGLPFSKKQDADITSDSIKSRTTKPMPYGLAIGVGSLTTLAVCWWTGHENWFLSFVGITANL